MEEVGTLGKAEEGKEEEEEGEMMARATNMATTTTKMQVKRGFWKLSGGDGGGG